MDSIIDVIRTSISNERFSAPAFIYVILSLLSFIRLMYAQGCVFKMVNNNSKRIHLLILCMFIRPLNVFGLLMWFFDDYGPMHA